MVPRLLAPARAMKSRTCADVFQPCLQPECRWTWPEVVIFSADQKDRGLWGREWTQPLIERQVPTQNRIRNANAIIFRFSKPSIIFSFKLFCTKHIYATKFTNITGVRLTLLIITTISAELRIYEEFHRHCPSCLLCW